MFDGMNYGKVPLMKYLVKKANRYYIHWNIPKEVRHLFDGKAIYSRSLQTEDLNVARVRRDNAVAELKAVVAKARVNPSRQRYLALITEIRSCLDNADDSAYEGAQEGYGVLLETAHRERDMVLVDAINTVLSDKKDIQAKYGMSLKEAAKLYLDDVKDKLASATVSRLRKGPDLFLGHLNKTDILFDEFDRRDVSEWIYELQKDNKTATVKGYLSALSQMWEWCYRRRDVDGVNPFKELTIRLKDDSESYQPFEPGQLALLIETAPDDLRLLIQLALVTGCRINELVALEPSVFTEIEGVHVFKIQEGKTLNSIRTVPLPYHYWLMAKDAAERAMWKRSETGDAKYWSQVFGRHKRLTLPDCGKQQAFHSFRGMTSTAYHRAGVNELTAAFIIGHSRKTGTLTYNLYSSGLSYPQLLEAVETMLASDYMQQFLKLFNK